MSPVSSLRWKHAKNFLDWSGWDCGKGLLQTSLYFHGKKIVMTVDSCVSQSLSPVAENTVIVLITADGRHLVINTTRTQWHKEETCQFCEHNRHNSQQTCSHVQWQSKLPSRRGRGDEFTCIWIKSQERRLERGHEPTAVPRGQHFWVFHLKL